MTQQEIDELREMAQKIQDLEPGEPFTPDFYQGLNYAADELLEWLDRKEAELENT
jgi:hypothetical protein